MTSSVGFLLVNLRTLVGVVASLFGVSIVVRYLGVDAYANVAVLLAFVSLINVFGNIVVDACMKKYMSSLNDGLNNFDFLNSAFALILILGCALSAISFLFYYAFPGFSLGYSVLFVQCFVVVAVVTLISGLLRVASFAISDFLIQSLAQLLSRLAYILALWVLLVPLGVGIWGVALATLVSSLVLLIIMLYDFRKSAPELRLSFAKADVCTMRSLMAEAGAMSLVYLGAFLSTSAILIVAKSMYLPTNFIFNLALALSVGGISGQLLTSFSYMVIPNIHKAVASGNSGLAIRAVRKTNAGIFGTLVLGLIFVYFEGGDVLSYWLGREMHRPVGYIVAATLYYGLSVFGIQWSHYYSASGLTSTYGCYSMLESAGSLAFATLFILLADVNAHGFVALLVPSAFLSGKLAYVSMRSGCLVRADFREFLRVIKNIALFSLIAVFIHNLLLDFVSAVRCVLVAVPLVIGAWFNYLLIRERV